MRLKYFMLVLVALMIATDSNARPNPDEIGICYIFNGDDVIDYNVCVISTGYGAGGDYVRLKLTGKEYLVEGIDDAFGDRKYSLNGEVVEIYNRDNWFLQKVDSEQLQPDQDLLFCYKTKKLDLCHN